MAKAKTDVLQGTLTMLVLKILSRGPLHGYAIAQSIQGASHDLLRVEEGSLYPALHRMEQEGWIQSEWGLSESRHKARVYSLTVAGHRQLVEEQHRWEKLTTGVREVLRLN